MRARALQRAADWHVSVGFSRASPDPRFRRFTLVSMSRRSADEISGDPALQARFLPRRASVPAMSAAQRDAQIVKLSGQGWSAAQIGKAVGMTRRGVEMALARIAQGRPGRVRGE